MPSYKFNEALGGIEIYFEAKPSEPLLEELKNSGWRWHRAKKCWYNKQSHSSIAFAERICGFPDRKRKTEQDKTQGSTIPPQTTSVRSRNMKRFTTEELHNDILKLAHRMDSMTSKVDTIGVSYYIVSGSTILSQVTITKIGNKYTVSSTNNQIICSDCGRMFSIHAQCCPFCGCPLSYVLENSFNQFYNKIVEQQKREEESRRKQAEKERILEQQRHLAAEQERILAQRRKEEQQRIIRERYEAREKAIRDTCKGLSLSDATITELHHSGISIDDLERRIIRIKGYQDTYPSLNIKMSMFITNDKIGEFVSAFSSSQGRGQVQCIGNCSTCNREYCIEEKLR